MNTEKGFYILLVSMFWANLGAYVLIQTSLSPYNLFVAGILLGMLIVLVGERRK